MCHTSVYYMMRNAVYPYKISICYKSKQNDGPYHVASISGFCTLYNSKASTHWTNIFPATSYGFNLNVMWIHKISGVECQESAHVLRHVFTKTTFHAYWLIWQLFQVLIRFGCNACNKNLLKSIFHYDFTEQKRKMGFVSVEDASIIDKKWKRVELAE